MGVDDLRWLLDVFGYGFSMVGCVMWFVVVCIFESVGWLQLSREGSMVGYMRLYGMNDGLFGEFCCLFGSKEELFS